MQLLWHLRGNGDNIVNLSPSYNGANGQANTNGFSSLLHLQGHLNTSLMPTFFSFVSFLFSYICLSGVLKPSCLIDYSCITFAEFLFCTPIPETLSISLKAAKEIRIFFVFRKLIPTFLIQKKTTYRLCTKISR